MKKGTKLNNAGFSLIELIVAILIMAIIGGATIGAFNAVLSTKTNAAAKTVQDSLKQTRVAALGRENADVPESGASSVDYTSAAGFKTNIYAKFYIENGTIYVDVCSDKGTSEVVLNTSAIGSDNYSVTFCNDTGGTIAKLDAAASDMKVYIYFRKSTGGVSRLYYTRPGTSGKTNGCEMIKVTSPSGEVVDIILVPITGRSYIDN